MGDHLTVVDKVQILTLQDNYIDFLAEDNSAIINRVRPLKGPEMGNSILAEHGFSALVTLTRKGVKRRLLFDFGFSEDGAARNAASLKADLAEVEVLVLSHGHPDHTGGLEELRARIHRPDIDLVAHPAVFKQPRFLKGQGGKKFNFPVFSRERVASADITLVASKTPKRLLGNQALFLGEIPRITSFETGSPALFYENNGKAVPDLIEDDTALVFHVAGQGLVILAGCAHAGIINTVKHAMDVTGVDQILAVMGGFHLSGADFESVIKPTADGLMDFSPSHVIPTHCTGRSAVNYIEGRMPDKFILNMAGTTLTFTS